MSQKAGNLLAVDANFPSNLANALALAVQQQHLGTHLNRDLAD